MANRETNVTNAAESTLSSSLAAGATTINVTDTSAFPSVPFYVVIDPDVDATREVILVDSSKTATTFTLTGASSRGQDGTTDTAHSSGAKIACVPVAALWTDINDRVDAAYVAGGTDVAVADGGTGASTAAGARTNLGLVIGTDVQAFSAVLAATTAPFTTADETKLDGIEDGADVTDATNVAAAGAVMESDTTTAAMGFVVDEDTMVSNSATKVPTQQSVKAYVDNVAATSGGTAVVVKASNESVASSTTLQADNDLLFAVGASQTWGFTFTLYYSGDPGDLKVTVTGPSGSTVRFGVVAMQAGGTDNTNSGGVFTGGLAGGSTASLGSTSGTSTAIVSGSVVNGVTAGNVELQWAQVNTNPTATTVHAGSTLMAVQS